MALAEGLELVDRAVVEEELLRAISVVLALLLSTWQTAMCAPWEIPAGVKTLTVNGYPMAYLEVGDGQPVVLVHGAVSDYRTWTNQVKSPPPGLRLIAVSLRHHYPERWDGKGDTFTTKQHAADLAAFVEQLRAGPVHLVAWSLGTISAFQMAQARPELVKKFVLMEPIFHSLVASSTKPPGEDRLDAVLKQVRGVLAQGDIEGAMEMWADRDVPGTWKKRNKVGQQVTLDNAWTVVGVATMAQFTCADVGSLRMPVLLVTGEQTPRRLATTFDAVHKCIPTAQRAVIPKAGHNIQSGNPTAFEAALVKFILD